VNRLFLMFVVLHAWSGGVAADEWGGRIELPARVSPPRTTVRDLPPLPAAASALAPMTFELVATSETPEGPRGKTTQTVLRTADRVLLVPEGGGSEWLFQRNPVDNRRVSGYLVDHARRQVLVHHDSDLRNRMRLHGWADVLTMRFDPQSLAVLHATGERETAGGETFDRYVARDQPTQGVSDVWWSDTLLLPLRLTVRAADAATTWTIERLAPGVDVERLDDPRRRFPQYTVLDISDSLERRH
jgi:hypothetical protein